MLYAQHEALAVDMLLLLAGYSWLPVIDTCGRAAKRAGKHQAADAAAKLAILSLAQFEVLAVSRG